MLDAARSPEDPWLTIADLPDYLDAQARVADAWRDTARWTRMSILNTAHSARFSTDRTMRDYNRDIWKLDPVTARGAGQGLLSPSGPRGGPAAGPGVDSAAAPARPHPLGAVPRDGGVDFALFSANATGVELCLFDERGERETARHALRRPDRRRLARPRPGARGRASSTATACTGPTRRARGTGSTPTSCSSTPTRARSAARSATPTALYGFVRGHADGDLSFDARDSAPDVPQVRRARAARRPAPARSGVARRTARDAIYEAHVKNLTMRFPGVPTSRRGTYAGVASRPVVRHLEALGVRALELLPLHELIDDHFLVERGLVNHWGYNTLCFLAPAARYAAGDDPAHEFRAMVRTLHRAGIEVLLDVVYNHSCEGNELGPTLCYRGIDNASYYRLAPDRRHYVNDTGCGNTLAAEHPRVLQLIMDSLRFWVTEMGVDGFRFDLASVLGREAHGFDRGAGFFDAVAQDPALAPARLIAEPWDIGPGGYQLGQYPGRWSEWNDRFRDTVRRFWAGEEGQLANLSACLLGSSELFEWQRRGTSASVNFVTAHDGYTLADLVAHERKHNEANGEGNRDGHGDNHSSNHGVEGPTAEPRS